MPIIKSKSDPEAAKHAIALSFGDLRRDVSRILVEARAEAQRIVEEARAERERLIADAADTGLAQGKTEGYEAGFAEGRRAGEAAALAERAADLQALADAWAQALDAFEQQREALLRDARADLLRLALAIAERVVRRAIDADPQAAVKQLDAALSLALAPTRLVARASPADAQQLRAALPNLASRFADSPHTEVVEDAALPRGSCVVQTDRGEIDMRIDEQLARVAETLLPGRSPALPAAGDDGDDVSDVSDAGQPPPSQDGGADQ